MWSPPTPPQDDNDVYIDHAVGFLYEHFPMTESQMPPIYIKKEHKRARIDPAVAAVVRKHKIRKEEQIRVPRSLFDRPLTALKRDMKLLKLKQGLKPLKPQLMQSRPMEQDALHPEWLIHEDWALLQCVQALQELPLTLQTNSPANVPNWDLVADVVNSSCSRTYRSAKQCKIRYENVVVPREEGKILYDINPRKQKKSKGIYKTKNNRPMRTSQLFCQDSNQSITTLYTLRYDSCKSIAAKRTPAIRPTLANPTLKNPKHQAVLAESGINYEQPLSPLQVARNRAERIAKEKQAAAEQQQLAAQRAQQSQPGTTTLTQTLVGTVSATPATSAMVAASVGGTVVAAISQQPMTIVQGQPMSVTTAKLDSTAAGTTVVKTPGVAAVSLPRSLGTGSIVVNTALSAAAGNTFAAINKRMGQAVVGAVAQTPTAATVQAIRAPRPSVAQMTVQEITAAVVNQGQRLAAPGGLTTQVISTTTITPAQLVAAQKAGAVAVATGTMQHTLGPATARTLTPHHIQILKQQALLKAQAQQAARRISTVQTAGAIPTQQAAGSVTTVTQTVSGQKTIALTSPLITSVAQAPLTQGARLQVAKQPGLKRALTEAEMTLLLKRQQMIQQHQKLSGGTVQQVQVTQGQVTRLTTAQILTGTQVQHMTAGTASSSQPVATLVKTVQSQPGSSMPNVTIPVSAVSLSVSVPQQKSLAGRAMAPQVRHLQLQQMQRKNTQLQQAQKVATLAGIQHVKAGGGTTPLIIPQQQQGTLPKVMVQQIQQIVKQQQPQQGLGAPTIQQIITSMPPNQSSTATVIAAQLVTQNQPSSVQTVTKMSVPTISSVTTLAQPVRTAAPVTVTAVPAPNTVTATGTPHTVTLASVVGTNPTVTLTANQATLVKHVQEVVVSPQKTMATPQQVRTVHQTMRQIPGGLAVSQQPSASVQQAVQQVVQQAQAQAQQRVATAVQQVAQVQTSVAAAPSVPAPATSVVVSVAQPAVVQTPTTTATSQGAAAAAAAVQQLVVTQQQGQQQPGDGQGGTGKPSPYTMRLRNQRT